jgi:hypothetical protein
MSDASGVEAALIQAGEKEKEYDWLGAVEIYENCLASVSQEDVSRLGEIHERLGYALSRSAMQADSADEFRGRMHRAGLNYEKAREAYLRSSGHGRDPKAVRCDAMKAYVDHWLVTQASEKKKFLSECWTLAKESLKGFEEAAEPLEYGKTHNQLSSSTIFIFTREWDFRSREKIMLEAVETGEKAIKFLSKSNDASELARAYARTVVFLCVYGYYSQDVDEREKFLEKALDYWTKARQLSEEVALTEFLYPVFGGQPVFGLEGTDEAFANVKNGLEFGKKMRDSFIIGCAFDWLTYHTLWRVGGTEDSDAKIRLVEEASKYAEEARSQFSKICFVSPRGDMAWTEAFGITKQYLFFDLATDLKRKRDLLERVFQAAPDFKQQAEKSGYPEIILFMHSGGAGMLQQMARFETNSEEKKRLLEDALTSCDRGGALAEQLEPFLYWNLGVRFGQRGTIKRELADLAKDREAKRNLLQEAVADRKKAVEFCVKELTFMERKGSKTSLFASLGNVQCEYGNMLVRLFDLAGNEDLLREAQEAYRAAGESYQKLELMSRLAETCWRRAQVSDMLGKHFEASQNFDCSAAKYRSALEKTPQLRGIYNDHAVYMQAWSEIEKARHHHERQEYGLAEEHFEKAANMHKSLKQWSYLAPNYFAWAQVEHAEELSRKDQSEEALQAFEQAAGLFEESKRSIQDELAKIESPDEKQMATQVVNATDLRREYCLARIAIEEAKILDKKGDHYASSEKYRSASETLQKIALATESEQEKKEFKLISILSQAWAKMTGAEAEGSPDLYLEASHLFEEAKEFGPNEKAKMLALGHSRFCKALEAGTRFADTGDAELYKIAIQQLESAAKHYVTAGFQNASEYAKATELLLDAYMHMDNAKVESDPEKKARLYMMAEKVLQTSAGSFMKAEHPEKREQVLRLLDKVKEERELALSLSEVLHAPSIVSTTSAFTTPTPNQENAVGLEKFETANVQANLVTRQKQLKVGENLDLEIELVNAGKSSAQLIKITEVIPTGFELAEKPEIYRVEDSYLNMKGKRLDPLKTEEVRLTIKPKAQGEFSLKPTILYLDENGTYKSHQPEPVSITVKELGIKGWIRGEK